MKVIVTGATGMVGEGVLLECLDNEEVSEVLSISRKPCGVQHVKLKELLLADFTKLDECREEIKGYDACFYCAGVSSVGMKEEKYNYITYETTLAFARTVVNVNPGMSFCFVTGAGTDSSEQGRVMWARVKGKTENALMRQPFKNAYNFRPGVMLATDDQKNVRGAYKFIAKVFRFFAPSQVLTFREIGKAMIRAVASSHEKHVLEIRDIKALV